MSDRWWMPWGACVGVENPDSTFFPRAKRGLKGDFKTARKLCRKCPVRDYCLMYAVAHKIDEGFWGGKSARERKAMGRELRMRVRRVWFTRQTEIQLRGGEKLGERDGSIHSVPSRSNPTGVARDQGRGLPSEPARQAG